MPKRKHYQALILIPIVAVTVFLVFLNLKLRTGDTTEPETIETVLLPCSNEEATTIIKDASRALDPTVPENSLELAVIATKIRGYEKYENDPYCLHILTTNYVYEGDYTNAKKYMELLNAKLAKTESGELGRKSHFLTVAELNENVEFLKLNLDEIENNNPYGTTQ